MYAMTESAQPPHVLIVDDDVDIREGLVEVFQRAGFAVPLILSEHEFLQEEGIGVRLGASAGFATYPSEAQSKDALIRLADERMYKNKEVRRASRA